MSGKKRKKSWTSNLLLMYARWQCTHWVWSLILVRLLAVWFSFIVAFAGESWHLIKVLEGGKKQFTVFGFICTVLLVILVTLGEISLRYERETNKKLNDPGAAFMLRNLRDATSALCVSKYNTLVNEISKIKSTPDSVIPEIVSDPEKQLDGLANQMSNCLCQLLQGSDGGKWRSDDIFVSIAYEFPSEDSGVWHWATKERGLSLEDLFKQGTPNECISTMLHCLNNKGSKVFFNSKQKALSEKHYIPDPNDEYDANNELLGSIACYEDTIKKNDIVYIHYVLTISTYDKKFITIDEATEDFRLAEEAVKYNMDKIIVADFKARARVELCLLYLSMLQQTNYPNN